MVVEDIDGNTGIQRDGESNPIKVLTLVVEVLCTKLRQVLSEFVVTLGLLMSFQPLGQREELLEEGVDVVGVVRQQHLLVSPLLDDLQWRLLSVLPQQ